MAKRKVMISEDIGENVIGDHSPSTFNNELISSLKKQIDGIYVLGVDDTPSDVKEWLSTGSTQLDMAICNNPDVDGGIPVGRLTSISGPSSSGKSLLAYMILADCSRRGGVSVLIDTENAANIDFLRMQGLEPDKNLVYSQVDTVEDVFNVIETVIRKVRESDKNKLVTIVWDSIAGTSSKKEMEGEVGDSQVAMVPRLLGQGLRRITRMIGKQRICLVFLNQLRMKIGGMIFGDPFVEPGGQAVPFFSDVQIRLYSAGKIKKGENVIGVSTKAKVLKTRFGPPFRESMLNIYFDKGLIDEDSWFDYLKKKNLVEKVSAQKSKIVVNEKEYEFKNTEFLSVLNDNADVYEYIRKMIKQDMYVEQYDGEVSEDITIEEFSADEKNVL